ncbi:MAG: hypothetical protein AAFR38_03905 [Planctomycetota bacterium]
MSGELLIAFFRFVPASKQALVALTFSLLLCGCNSGATLQDPYIIAVESGERLTLRIEAAETLWDEAERGVRDRAVIRRALKDLAWNENQPIGLRIRSLELVFSDTTPEGEADSRALAQLMLPIIDDPLLADTIAVTAAERDWVSVTPALFRRLAEVSADEPTLERIETGALRLLHGERPLTTVAFETALRPRVIRDSRVEDRRARARRAAFDVLGRLDPDGVRTRSLVGAYEPDGLEPEVDLLVATIARGMDQLRVVPRTGREVEWIEQIMDGDDVASAAWREDVSAAVARVDAGRVPRVEMRQLEPIRWVVAHRPEWLDATRAELLSTAEARLEGRNTNRRTSELGIDRSRLRERLDDWSATMTWGDLITLLVLDEAVRSPDVVRQFFAHTARDRDDVSTEYGGILLAGPDSRPGLFRAQLFVPRVGDRISDNLFIASEAMIASGRRALAFYHLQVARSRNSKFAGPSPTDLAFVRRTGRTGIVATSITPDRLGIDYYQPDGVIVDLGEIRRPTDG